MEKALPYWVEENPLLIGILHFILDRRDSQLERGTEARISFRLDLRAGSKRWQAVLEPLRDPNQDEQALWDELQHFASKYQCFAVKPNPKRRPGVAEWQGAQLIFRDACEEQLRLWLNRPPPNLRKAVWTTLLEPYADCFENPAAFPLDGLELQSGFESVEEMVSCWASVRKELVFAEKISWRQLAARCFKGDSKHLELHSRQSLVRNLYPGLSRKIQERQLLLHIYLPAQNEQVIFIENQDTFISLAEQQPMHTALVYSEGYRGGAERIRNHEIARFSTFNTASEDVRQQFLHWWYRNSSLSLPVFFWGDLDYEGMRIGAALKKSFPELRCWRPGYDLLLDTLCAGRGHAPLQADKERQKPIQKIGCEYADGTLIPAMTTYQCHVDQETAEFGELPAGLL
ncbi:Wadjet anti-phage system protein JetD domain-containing protein [uncultured Microbulbifer sp.]|uniref:Wadjet anti-phage system protein JetD domain-containing protein n=1 Tax=uncultured Microbulbifer sp. TaxID=348147 RepID=UPI00261F7133|nr:Wadjet anti-phage system protein JetD domain-containing protein [uncultured Microbulbifer sp.]